MTKSSACRGAAGKPGKPRWGGWRPGAGRKPKGEVSGVAHVPRPRLERGALALVTLVLERDVPDPRSARVAAFVHVALSATAEGFGCRLEHVSLHRDHLHLILRVGGARILARAMTSLCVRLAIGLNRLGRRRGPVFRDRYEVRELVGARALREARRAPCAWRAAPELVTTHRPAACSAEARRPSPLRVLRPSARLQLVSSAMRARNSGPSSAAFLSPTPLMARNSSAERGLRAASSARVRSLKIK